MIDASIPLQVQPAKYDDPSNQLMRILQIQGLQDARTKEQRALEQQTAMNDAYGGALGADGNLDRNKLYSLLAGKGQGSQIPAAQKTYADLDNKQSDTDKNKALATKDTTEAENKTIAMYRDASTAITDPASAVEFVKHMHSDPRLANSAIARIPLEQAIAQIPQDPNQLGAWKQQFALGASKFMELNKPTTNVVNTGGQTQMVQTPGLGGAPTVAGTFQNTQDPNNIANNTTSVENNKRSVGAQYAIAQSARDAASINAQGNRDAASIKDRRDTEMKVSDDYRNQSKGFKEVADAHAQLTATLKNATTSPAATLAGATKFMKMIDPGSVVRESELGMALNAQGVFDKAANYINVLKNGKTLTAAQAKDFENTATQIYNAAAQQQQTIDGNYRKQAQTYGLREDVIVQDLGQNKQPGGASAVPSDIAAILQKHGGKGR